MVKRASTRNKLVRKHFNNCSLEKILLKINNFIICFFQLVPGFSQMCQTAVANLMQKNPGAEMFSKDSVRNL